MGTPAKPRLFSFTRVCTYVVVVVVVPTYIRGVLQPTLTDDVPANERTNERTACANTPFISQMHACAALQIWTGGESERASIMNTHLGQSTNLATYSSSACRSVQVVAPNNRPDGAPLGCFRIQVYHDMSTMAKQAREEGLRILLPAIVYKLLFYSFQPTKLLLAA